MRFTHHWLMALVLGAAFNGCSAAPLRSGDDIQIWDTLPPGSATQVVPRANTSAPVGNELHNNIAGIVRPSMVAFVPEKPNGVSIIVVPGGSYTKLVAAKEGADIARWLNTLGITAFVLKHRLPNEGHERGRHVPLQDGQRAIRVLRQHAAEWQLDPTKVGIMGFSAGGHLAATTGTAFEVVSYSPQDATDHLSPRPDFVALIYAAVGFPAAHNNTFTPESQAAFGEYATDEAITANTPPTFMLVAADDVHYGLARNNVRYWQVLQQAGNAAERHIAATGGHGFALKPDATPSVKLWPQLFETWLKAKGLLAP